MKNKNKNKKIIKNIVLAGGISAICLTTTAFATNINEKNIMSTYSNIVKSVNQDLIDKELIESYCKLFEESKLYDTLIKEFNEIKSVSIEETKEDITITFDVDSDKTLENEKELYKEELNDLFNKLNSIDSNKDIVFEIDVNYEYDKDLINIRQQMCDIYKISKIKFDDNSLEVRKTKHYNQVDDWESSEYIYNIKEESFRNPYYIEKDFKDKKDDEATNLSTYELEKITNYEEGSVNSSFRLRLLDNDFAKSNPKELMDTLIEELSSDNNFDNVSININAKKIMGKRVDNSSKYYKATLDKTGNVVEYDFD